MGCDASILLDSTATNLAKTEVVANCFLGGLNIIDDAKASLEAECPRVVSCADILALATRDVVGMLEAGPSWTMRTGCRDFAQPSMQSTRNAINNRVLLDNV